MRADKEYGDAKGYSTTTPVTTKTDISNNYQLNSAANITSIFYATVIVNNTSDVVNGDTSSLSNLTTTPGPDGISLREAIIAGNNTPNAGTPHTINFDLPGAGPQTISPLSPLPNLISYFIFDGTSDPDYSGQIVVFINGASAGTLTDGFTANSDGNIFNSLFISGFDGNGVVLNGNNQVITACVVSGNGRDGIFTLGSSNSFTNNIIGLDTNGQTPLPNAIDGIRITDGSSSNTIGGTGANAGNIISGNGEDGISIWSPSCSSCNNQIFGNIIGLDVSGTMDRGNGITGINIVASGGNVIGGNTVGHRNIISGNNLAGIGLAEPNTSNTIIQGNYIGTDITGLLDLGNSSDGINLFSEITGTIIGGTLPEVRNIISGNGGDGIEIGGLSGLAENNRIEGNFIGLGTDGNTPIGNDGFGINSISGSGSNTIGGLISGMGNVISNNTLSGISLSGVTTNTIIQGNIIGLNVSGNTAAGNGVSGIRIAGQNNTVGGGIANARNIISANGQTGIFLAYQSASNNTVQGNYIGTDISGNSTMGNTRSGILINASANNLIGGNTALQRNVIGGNGENGVYIEGTDALNNVVIGNYIGIGVNGTTNLGNGTNGIYLRGGAQGTQIGGSSAAERNIISNNGQNGMYINAVGPIQISSNFIGTDATGNGNAGNNYHGIQVFESSGIEIGTAHNELLVISGNGIDGIRFSNASNNIVQRCYLGTNANATAAIPNQGYGIQFVGTSSANRIGTDSDGNNDSSERNIISGNGAGIRFHTGIGVNNIVAGNYIGTDITGNVALANSTHGIVLGDISGNRIGTNGDGVNDENEGNVISGNGDTGIRISSSNNNSISGNKFGIGADGSSSIPNGDEAIYVAGSSADNSIGYNGTSVVSDANIVGNQFKDTNRTAVVIGDSGLRNRISRNSFSNSAGLGIDLNNDLVSSNDNGDGDTGPNTILNFPVIETAEIVGTVLSITGFAPANSEIEFYEADAGPSPNPNPYAESFGEGERYLFTVLEGSGNDLDGTTGTYTNDGTGAGTTRTQNRFEFSVDISALALASASRLTALAIDTNGNTSEFNSIFTATESEICNDGIDNDGDGLTDCEDPDCYLAANSGDSDNDGDGIGDSCDLDDDNDGILDCDEQGLASISDLSTIFQLNGAATQINANTIQLTAAATYQAGSMMSQGRIDFTKSFELRMEANLGSITTAGGGDGIAIVFHNDPAGINAVGGNARGLGAVGIQNGIVLELDTYNNTAGAVGDIAADHGQIWDSDNQSGVGLLTTAVALGELEDGAFHDIVIIWDANTQNISFMVDGLTAGSFTNDLITNYFGGANSVFFGYTSSTGGAINNHSIRIINFCDTLPLELDTDNDGIVNHLDPDSDNDSCFDTVEAGHADGDNDGILGGSPVTVDAQGRVTGQGGYTGVSGNEIIATEVTINLDPSDKTVNEGGSTTFNVNAAATNTTNFSSGNPDFGSGTDSSGQLRYQWQENGSNLSDGGVYSGTNTNTLVLSDVTGLNGNTYTVIVTHLDNNCIAESRTAILTTTNPCDAIASGNPDADGDGISDSCDLDDDNDGITDSNEFDCSSSFLAFNIFWTQSNPAQDAVQINTPATIANAQPFILGTGVNAVATQNRLEFTDINSNTLSESMATNEYVEYAFTTENSINALLLGDLSQTKNPTSSGATAASYGYHVGMAISDDGFTTSTLLKNDFYVDENIPAGYDHVFMLESNADYILDPATTYTIRVYFFNKINPGIARFDDFAVLSFYCSNPADTDGDGIYNKDDVDSDNDGCFDTVEAGHADGDNDGILGNSPVSVDTDGRVTGQGGYTGATGNELIATEVTVNTPPANQNNIPEGNSTSFSVDATAVNTITFSSGTPNYGSGTDSSGQLRYRWQENGVDLSDGSVYLGTDTNTLSISDVTGLDGNTYTVIITHLENNCISENRSATLTTVNPCDPIASGNPDSDGDGISDICDLDDDNDGILDTEECENPRPLQFQGLSTTIQSYSVFTTTITQSLVSGSVVGSDSDDNGNLAFRSNGTSINISASNLSGFLIGPATNGNVDLDGIDRWTISSPGADFTVSDPLNELNIISNSTGSIIFMANIGNPQNWSLGVNDITDLTLTMNQGNPRSDLNVSLIGPCGDADNDGFINSIDLDSDNDGCLDTVEAGHADGDNDGILGNSPVTVDPNGLVTGQGGYTGTNTNVTTPFVPVVVSSQPSNVSANIGSTVSFTAVVTGGASLSYQWQESTDNGVTWNDLTESGIYSGTSTPTLTLTGISSSVHNYGYRLAITSSDNLCDVVTSDAADVFVLSNISISDATVVEGSDLIFTITLSHALSSDYTDLELRYTNISTSNDDYDNSLTMVTIPANTTSFTVNVPTNDDGIIEATETLEIELQFDGFPLNPLDLVGIGTITDNDGLGAGEGISVADFTVDESAGTADFVITYTGPTVAGSFTVDFTVADGTAVDPDDYSVATAGTSVTFPDGTVSGDTQNVTVNILDDVILEASENIDIALGTVSNILIPVIDGNGVGTI
ncbi:beta strand repeat-containing protein, partial [Maribacter chungangensis]